MNHICIICNEDALTWDSHIRSKCLEVNPAYRIQTLCGSQGLDTDAKTCPSRLYVVVASLGLIDHLANNSNLALKNLIPKSSAGILLFCGSDIDDFKKPKKNNLRPLSDRFVNFEQWKKYHHEGVEIMVDYIVSVLKTSKIYCLLPSTVSCEGHTTVVVSFDESISVDEDVYILMKDEDVGLPLKVTTSLLNPYTVSFVAPEHKVGGVKVDIMIGDQTITSADALSITYTSQLHVVGDLTEIYIHQLTMLCDILLTAGTKSPDIDSKIISFFESDVIPLNAFELLFGIYRNTATERSRSELPTLLHFAARYGFQELCSRLIDLPDAALAFSMANKNDQTPEELAESNGHNQLATFLKNSREMTEGLDVFYTTMIGYVRHDPDERYKTDGYLKPVRPGTNPGYINMNPGKSNGVNHRLSNDSEDYVYTVKESLGETKPSFGPTPPKAAQRLSDPNKRAPAPPPGSQGEVSPVHVQKPERFPPGADIPVTPANGVTAALFAPLTVVSGASPYSHYANTCTRKEHSEKKLIEILEMVKNDKLTIADAEILFQEWRLKYQNGPSRSFRENQENLARARAEVSEANGSPLTNRTNQPDQSGSSSKPQKPIPSKKK